MTLVGGLSELSRSAMIWRVAVQDDGRTAISLISMPPDPLHMCGEYAKLADAPDWVQKHVALLVMRGPAGYGEWLEGVGYRASENVFWVYRVMSDA